MSQVQKFKTVHGDSMVVLNNHIVFGTKAERMELKTVMGADGEVTLVPTVVEYLIPKRMSPRSRSKYRVHQGMNERDRRYRRAAA